MYDEIAILALLLLVVAAVLAQVARKQGPSQSRPPTVGGTLFTLNRDGFLGGGDGT